MKEIEWIITEYGKYAPDEAVKAIEQYVIKARIEAHKGYTHITCSHNNYARRMVKKLKAELKKGLSHEPTSQK